MLSLIGRTWIRYVVPLTAIAAVTMFLVVLSALRVGLPGDVAAARVEMHLGWELAALGLRNQAVAAYQTTLSIDPAYERARNNLAVILRR